MKEIKDYLHLYLGCECMYEDEIFTLDGVYGNAVAYSTEADESGEGQYAIEDVKPILRPLSDIKDKEADEMNLIRSKHNAIVLLPKSEAMFMEYVPEIFRYLLSKHFDLFGLIDAVLAIDKKYI